MKIKEIFFIILGIALVLGAGYYLYTQNISKVSAPNNESQTGSTKIEDQKITDDTKPFKIDITYPHILGAEELNQKMDDFITVQTNDFKKLSMENDQAVKETDPVSYAKYPREYNFNANYDKGQIDGDVISFVMNVYSFVGGAHGAEVSTAFNYNAKTGKEIKLADLFANQPDYLQKISNYCIKDLEKQISSGMEDNGEWVKQNSEWINEGAGPKEQNYSVFLINKDNIVFYFQQYQVAPYAAGTFKVTMPR
jgi:hypothetical protein